MSKKLREGEIRVLLQSAVIIVDTREKCNQNITDYFDSKGIAWESKKLDSGDYSLKIPANENIGNVEIDMSNLIAVERKKTLDELVGNLTNGRERFFREFERFMGTMVIVVEENQYMDILTHNYRSEMAESSLNGSIMAIHSHFNIPTFFLHNRQASPRYIYTWLLSQAKEVLRGIEMVEE